MNEENLPLTDEFAANRSGNLLLAVGTDVGENRVTLFGRGCQGRHFTDAGDRHFKCSRNRSCRHRENVDVGLHLLELLFVLNAETLLFIDDDQTKLAELDRFGKQTVGSDDHVYRAICKTGEGFFDLFGRLESR